MTATCFERLLRSAARAWAVAATLLLAGGWSEINAWAAEPEGTVTAGKLIAVRDCEDCHGRDGNSISPTFPRLAAQTEVYLTKQLHQFKGRHRIDPTSGNMWTVAEALNEQQIKDIASYFSQQKGAHGPAAAPDVMAEGQKIFQSGIPDKGVPACSACHGANAQGSVQTEAPRLAGQWRRYLVAQLNGFHSEERPSAVAMHAIVQSLSAQNIDVLAQYLQSLRTD
jgi:cbb3-type cytochrome c oxidase subunit III